MSDKSLKPLTKSRFKIGHDCPRKLYYKNRSEYQDDAIGDEFLLALAEGGFQVGALAQVLFSPGVEVTERGYAESLLKTKALLTSEKIVTVFEGAIGNHAQFARVDILRKTDSEIELIEVKSASFDSTDGNDAFWRTAKTGRTIRSDWEPYLLDVAYQTWIARKHLRTENGKPFNVTPFLMLVDKSTTAGVEGLNQKFKLVRGKDGRASSHSEAGVTAESLGSSIMVLLDVSDEVEFLLSQKYGDLSFDAYVGELTSVSLQGTKPDAPRDERCKGCDFRLHSKDLKKDFKNGFVECWNEDLKVTPERFDEPLVFDLYYNRNTARQLASGKLFLSDLENSDLLGKTGGESSYTPRQRLQLAHLGSREAWLNSSALAEIKTLEYPLHFIDFETCMPALPFNVGRRPYEQIAFQFSHHVAEADGSIRHANEFLEVTPGKFPNFEFIRALRKAIGDAGGTVLRFSNYENTVLNQIRVQLKRASATECVDRSELIKWIESLAKPTGDNAGEWGPTRTFIDMMDWVKNGFYYPSMNGSTSIKKVLPAVLEWSPILLKIYSEPVYGTGCGVKGGIESLNFAPTAWVRKTSSGEIVDPYKNLPPLFSDFADQQDLLFQREILNDGAAAMTAYQRLQFTEMSDAERDAIKAALLRYCELDTLAMVMIWQALREE